MAKIVFLDAMENWFGPAGTSFDIGVILPHKEIIQRKTGMKFYKLKWLIYFLLRGNDWRISG